jgi:hypothetical protein
MAEQQPKKPGLRAKRREKKRLKQARTGDTPEKREQPAGDSYDAKEMGTRAWIGGAGGGGGA